MQRTYLWAAASLTGFVTLPAMSLKTPAGTFSNVLRTEESSPLEPLVRESKYYARGVGLIQDGDLKLTKHTVSLQASSRASR